ncbi:hypothetical protein Lal_00011714 [Lupinus albus]|nr:hypothetical protein Lal_00011714 [Lupinus albus]
MDMIKTHPEKKKKIPNLKWQSIERNACAITNVHTKFTQTVTLCPADLVSNGNVSLGISQPKHLNTSFQQENTSSKFVNRVDRDNSGDEINSTSNDSRIQGSIILETKCVKENRSIKHYCIDASELLKHLKGNGNHKLRSVVALEEIPERVLNLFSYTTCLNKF